MNKKTKVFATACFCVMTLQVSAQENNGTTLAGRNTGQPAYPQSTYRELSNPVAVNPQLRTSASEASVISDKIGRAHV